MVGSMSQISLRCTDMFVDSYVPPPTPKGAKRRVLARLPSSEPGTTLPSMPGACHSYITVESRVVAGSAVRESMQRTPARARAGILTQTAMPRHQAAAASEVGTPRRGKSSLGGLKIQLIRDTK